MIESVKQIKTMKAIDLPRSFDVRIGSTEYPMMFDDTDGDFVYIYSIDTNETINIPCDEMVTVLVHDTWDNASLDIEFALMEEGLI